MDVNFGLTADDYTKHRAGFPDTFFERVFADGYVKAGDTLLDIGTGTGTLARGFAMRGCHVTGTDYSAQMVERAKEMRKQQGLDVVFRVAPAEETGFPDSTFDIVTAGQCWHWFDRPRAADEVKRILKPGGTVIIAHFDWIPITGNVVDLTEKLINKHNPNWKYGGGTGMYPEWLRDLGETGFENIVTFSFDVDAPYTADAWRGRIRASAGVGASLSPEAVSRFDSQLKLLLEEKFQVQAGNARVEPGRNEAVLPIPHRIFAVIAHNPIE
jgi:SAM-dependent methyltransferase